MKKTSCTPKPYGWLCLVATATLAGCTASRQNPTEPTADDLLGKVVAEKIDLDLAGPRFGRSNLLWDHFANKPYESQFSRLSSEHWQRDWPRFRDRLVAKARAGGLDAVSLARIIDGLKPEPNGRIAMLPVGAFAARKGNDDVWIVIVKWEYPTPHEVQGKMRWPAMGHIAIDVFRTKDGELVDSVRCG